MTTSTLSPRDQQRLQQEAEAWRLRKVWFWIKAGFGFLAMVGLVAVGIAATIVILNDSSFSEAVVTGAVACLFVDFVGLLTLIVKLVFGDSGLIQPVTTWNDESYDGNTAAGDETANQATGVTASSPDEGGTPAETNPDPP